ncbi:hypothetical protein PoB_004803600 [Plakobranchus ocellatus]|uniref:Uncharacterized protein n=1 Tax=Plakobranchus ocellatus TaxID=259542 RepID=A0AAV4BM54_9GAST|nr:hypothetical protein PoB_004803600 [Plakobranchus ocellatus]
MFQAFEDEFFCTWLQMVYRYFNQRNAARALCERSNNQMLVTMIEAFVVETGLSVCRICRFKCIYDKDDEDDDDDDDDEGNKKGGDTDDSTSQAEVDDGRRQ